MKKCILWSALFLAIGSFAQDSAAPKQPATLRSILLMELGETHNDKQWFVSEKEAVADLTPEQAAWSDGKNHSAGALVEHMNYWNSVNLAAFKKQPAPKTPNNDATFDFDAKRWETALKDFDRIMGELESFV